MNRSRTLLVATAVSLLLKSALASAGPAQFNMPTTELAQKSAELLRRAADGFFQLSPAAANRADGQRITDLWLYPTGDVHTVFAGYTLGSKDGSYSSNQHLSVLTVQHDQIVAVRELTDARNELTRENARVDGLHWSAAIGAGHTLDSTVARIATGAPTSPDWTASIGNGRAALLAAPQLAAPLPLYGVAPTVEAHWSSKIGTGRGSESELGEASAQQDRTIAALNVRP